MKLFAITFALLLALFIHRKHSSVWTSALIALLALTTMAMAAFRLLHSAYPEYVRDEARSPGRRLAQLVVHDVKPAGPVLVVRMPPAVAGPADAMNTLLQDLRQELVESGFTLVGLTDPPGATNAWARTFSTSRPGAEIFQLYVDAHPEAVAMVSLVGLPDCTPADLAGNLPPFYIFGGSRDMTNDVWIGSASFRQIITSEF